MLKVIATNVSVSKGFNGEEALKFSKSESSSSVQFKIGYRAYDSRAEGNHRYINMAVKAFNGTCERIEKMKLKEGSFVNIMGRLDEEKWEDNGQKFSRMVVIVEDIEYASNGSGKTNGENGTGTAPAAQNGGSAPPPAQSQQSAPPRQNQQSSPPPGQPPQNGQTEQAGSTAGFGGYESFGSENPFFPTGGQP